MKISDIKEKINKLEQITQEIPNTLIAISQSNASSRSSKKFFDKFFEISDGGNPNWDV